MTAAQTGVMTRQQNKHSVKAVCTVPVAARFCSLSLRAGVPDADQEQPDLHYNLLPRKVDDFQPYGMTDYVGQNYDSKHANYWRLGGLGCSASEELKARSCLATSASHAAPAGLSSAQ